MAAFDDLEAGLLSADKGGTWFPRQPVGTWAQYYTLHLMTKHGPLDIMFVPDGAERGYDDLSSTAETHRVDGAEALVISVATWERVACRQRSPAKGAPARPSQTTLR